MSQEHVSRTFTAEVTELLGLLAHSLYSNPEVFLRELISNASDALDKRKTLSLLEPARYEAQDPKIHIEVNEAEKTITVRDNGIGMSHDDVIEHLGTLASSGTKKFMQQYHASQESGKKELIGQFGVGFYSAFVVADRVEVVTRRADQPADQAVRWVSDGKGSYTLGFEPCDETGTSITLHLHAQASEFASLWRIRQIIGRYSDYIKCPIMLKNDQGEWEQVNKAKAIWTKGRHEISDEEYAQFYQDITHDFEAPLAWTHNKVEGNHEYTLLLYVPKRAPFDLWHRDMKKGVKLFVNRVYIMDGVDVFLPNYLRFVRGVIDAAALPLNVSRELLQKNEVVDVIRQGCVKRVLDMLEKMTADPEQYAAFWKTFGAVLKEGPIEDSTHFDRLQGLLRFSSTEGDCVSLSDYLARMKPEQSHIYYLTAESEEAARWSPHLGWFRKHGVEVLLMHDRVDEWLMSRMTEFQGKQFKSVAQSDLELPSVPEEEEVVRDLSGLLERLKAVYGDEVENVIENRRLVDAPVSLVKGAEQLAPHLIKMLRDAGQFVPDQKFTLGINPNHPVIVHLMSLEDEASFADLARVLLGQAILAEGGTLGQPMNFIQALNRILV